jgi:hypothetical protein
MTPRVNQATQAVAVVAEHKLMAVAGVRLVGMQAGAAPGDEEMSAALTMAEALQAAALAFPDQGFEGAVAHVDAMPEDAGVDDPHDRIGPVVGLQGVALRYSAHRSPLAVA